MGTLTQVLKEQVANKYMEKTILRHQGNVNPN